MRRDAGAFMHEAPGVGAVSRMGEALLRVGSGLALALFMTLLGLPMLSMCIRVPLDDFLSRLTSPVIRDALWLSLITSLSAAVVIVLLGLPVAYLLATKDFPGRRLLEVVIDLPMVLPPTVAGVGLLLAFGRAGLAGGALSALGITIPFSTLGVVLAQTFMAAPFFVNAARSGFEAVEPRYLQAAATLRASPTAAFLRVVLPLSLPSLTAGAVMSWARALGEFGATITFAGNLPGSTQTMPLAVYVALQSDLETAITLSVILLIVPFLVLFALRTAAATLWHPSPRARSGPREAARRLPA